ncbi:MAG: choice-of-anchor V domain-containing protein [Betaproteobacteria bacterium]
MQWRSIIAAHMAVVMLLLIMGGTPFRAYALSTGIPGKTNGGGGCTSCHGVSVDSGIAVAVSGPTTRTAGQLGTYTITATKGGIADGLRMGFDVSSSDGALSVVAGQSTSLVGSEITHNVSVGALATTAGGTGSASYTFNYTVPASAAGGSTHTIYSVSHLQTVAGSQTAGWNYGANFTITVPPTAPSAPTAVVATAANGQATVSFAAAIANGSPISKYTVTANPAAGTDVDVNTAATTHTITGLANGVSYTFTVTATNAVGTGPASTPSNSVTPTAVPQAAIAVNPLTNRIYATSYAGNSLVIRNGATNIGLQIPIGSGPAAVAVNTASNKIYVANFLSGNVTVVDGATNGTSSIAVGSNPIALAVNNVTGKIYVANYGSSTVTVIDDSTGATTPVTTGTGPIAVAVNPATNKIYVANFAGNNVTVIDGATNATTTVATGSGPGTIAINQVTNKIYVANTTVNSISVIDGGTNAVSTFALGGATSPIALALNPITNKIYAATFGNSTVSIINGANNTFTNVAAGTNPRAIGVNAMTNRIYVANQLSNNLTLIDGATNTTSTVFIGTAPGTLAINPVTNKVYSASVNNSDIYAYDGSTYVETTISVGLGPRGIAVNPVTNKVYTADASSNTVTVIDGITRATSTVIVGASPELIEINPRTNKIYVLNYSGGNVTVIDGATNVPTTIAAGLGPYAIAVNPVTNKIYATNPNSNAVTVIDGVTQATSSIPVGISPREVAVNPATNRIYVTNFGNFSCDGNVTVIDGYTGATTPIATSGCTPNYIAVNPATNKIYVGSSNIITAIDGATNATSTIGAAYGPIAVDAANNLIYVNRNSGTAGVDVISGADGSFNTVATYNTAFPRLLAVNPATRKAFHAMNFSGTDYLTVVDGALNPQATSRNLFAGNTPWGFAVNPLSGRTYVSNIGSSSVTEVVEQEVQNIPLTVAIGALAGHTTNSATPTLTLTTGGTLTARRVYFQLDTWQGAWLPATGSAPNFSAMTFTLLPGTHVLYAFATDGEEAGSTSSMQSSPLIGPIAAYPFTVIPAPANLLSVVSRKQHGALPCDLQLDRTKTITQAVTVEPRSPSPAHTIVYQFDAPIVSGGTASAVDGAAAPVPVSSVNYAGNEVFVSLGNVQAISRATVSLANANNGGMTFPVSLGFLPGDVSSSRLTSAADIAGVKAQLNKPLTTANCVFDLNVSGTIDSSDLAAVRSRSGVVLP